MLIDNIINPLNQDKIKNFYDKQVLNHPDSPAILGCKSKLSTAFRTYIEWETLTKMIKLKKDMKILELGCGAGRWVEAFSKFVEYVEGVDFSENAIETAKNNAYFKGIQNVNYVSASIFDFEPDKIYDIIYFSGIMIYLNDDDFERSVSKFSKYLKSDGVFIVRDSIAFNRAIINHNDEYTAIYRTLSEHINIFSKYGFKLYKREIAFNFNYSRALEKRYINRMYLISQHFKFSKMFLVFLHKMLEKRKTKEGKIGEANYSHDFLVFTRENKW